MLNGAKKIFLSFLLAFPLFVFLTNSRVYAGTLTLTPSTGVVSGQEIVVTGTAFDNSTLVTFTWDGVSLTTNPVSVTTSGAGAIPASGIVSFVIPSAMYGAHTVRASTSTNNYGVATLTIATPTVAITSPTVPTAGLPPGVTLTVTATNLEASTLATFYFDDTSVYTSTSTVNGTAEAVFVIPDVNNTGAHLIRVTNSVYAVASVTVIVAAPSITLLPATATQGQQVNIVGTNFKANAAVTFYFNSSSLTPDSSVTTSGAGGFAVTFTIPDVSAGSSTVRAQSYTNLYATAALTISTPALTLNPITGPDGLPLYATGTGFTANATVNFYVNGDRQSTTTTTSAIGGFGVQLTLPTGLLTGASTVRAQTSGLVLANATYTVIAPTLTVSPAAGTPGTQVVLTGLNFNPSASVTIKWNGTVISPVEKNLTTTNSGGFSANITIPYSYVPGTNQITATTSDKNTVVVSFIVGASTLTLSVSTGVPGTKISVTGANFEGNKTLFVFWDDARLVTNPALVTTTPLGGFSTIITIPKSGRGTHNITAYTTVGLIFASSVFTISSPTLTLSTTAGQANSRLIVSGTGFGANQLVSFTLDSTTDISSSEPVNTDATGFFSAIISLPANLAPGNHVFVATTGIEIFASSTLTITSGTLSLSQSNSGPLAPLQITGSAFDAYKTVYLFWDDTPIELGNLTTDGTGGFMANITIPQSSPGVHSIRVSTGPFSSYTTTYTLDSPTITISPSDARLGQEITVLGSGFTANKKVNITANGRKIKTRPANLTTDSGGNFLATVEVPFTLFYSMSLGANTSDHEKVIVNYPVTHSALYNVFANVVIYGFFVLLALLFIISLWKSYKYLRQPASRKKIVSFIRQQLTRFAQALRYFFGLSHEEKIRVVKTWIVSFPGKISNLLPTKKPLSEMNVG